MERPERLQDRRALAADRALMEAIVAGDRGAFARLVREQTPRLLRFAIGLLDNQAEAEELVQESLLRLWRHAATWQPEARISTWLHRVVYNLAIDRIRRRRPGVPIETVHDSLHDPAPGLDETLAADDAARRLREAIARLPERQRTAVLLCHFQELSQSEASRIMEIGEHAYESLLARARRRLREMLDPHRPAVKGDGHAD